MGVRFDICAISKERVWLCDNHAGQKKYTLQVRKYSKIID